MTPDRPGQTVHATEGLLAAEEATSRELRIEGGDLLVDLGRPFPSRRRAFKTPTTKLPGTVREPDAEEEELHGTAWVRSRFHRELGVEALQVRVRPYACVRARARALVRACLRAFSCVCARVLVRACSRVFACVHACDAPFRCLCRGMMRIVAATDMKESGLDSR